MSVGIIPHFLLIDFFHIALEKIFAHRFKGYCGGKNWQELSEYYKKMHDKGLIKTAQSDGKCFDMTQDFEIKQIVDQAIYEYISKRYQLHVPKTIFLKFAMSNISTYVLNSYTNKSKKMVAKFSTLGQVQSGNMDTTLMNTTRMALYCRFTLERIGYRYSRDFEVMAKGDDVVVFYAYYIPNHVINNAFMCTFESDINATEGGLGQVMKYLKLGYIDDIDFCSTATFRKRDGRFRIYRQPNRFMLLTPWSETIKEYVQDPEMIKYIRYNIGFSILAWGKNLPIFEAYARNLMKYNSDYKVKPSKIDKINSKIRLNLNDMEKEYMQQHPDYFGKEPNNIDRIIGNSSYWSQDRRYEDEFMEQTDYEDLLFDWQMRYGIDPVKVRELDTKIANAKQFEDIETDVS